MVKTLGLTHLALTVRDLNRSFQFYHDVFGMLATYRQPSFIQAQTPGREDILVLEKSEEEGGREPTNEIGKSGGIKHFGFRLTDARDIDKAVKSIEQAGGKILDRGEFVPGEPYVFFNDPDGYNVEVWYELPAEGLK
jgi:catechol 2,3-dioxygenase-like lactoylglutathione lyase family enzyme